MSSSIYFEFDTPVPVADWLAFCAQNGIEYSPATIGRNVFYAGQVEISFGRYENYDDWLVKKEPPPNASKITVSSYHGSNLSEIAGIARKIKRQFGGKRLYDPELESFVK